MKIKTFISKIIGEAGIGIALIFIIIIFMFATPHFATTLNIKNIFTQITINIILSVGMTFVILIGGIDLSVGATMALATVIAGTIMKNPSMPIVINIILAVVASIGVGCLFGFLNGFISENWKLPSFIVTLGTLNIARGAALMYTDARTIFQLPSTFTDFGTSTIIGGLVPQIFVVALCLVIISWFILNRTVFGRLLFAIGNNEEAVRLSGHPVSFYKIIAFIITGFTVGVAGIIYMARLTIASPILGNGFELNAIAAVIIGGTSMNGGKGSMVGTFLGACLMGALNNGLILMGIGDFARQIITGAIIIGAVIADTYRAKLSNRPI